MKKLFITIFILCLALISATCTFAETSSSSLHVSASVLPFVQYNILHQESTVTITEDDITRGYIDVEQAIIYRIKTNSRNGHLLIYSVDSSLFKEILLLGNHYSHSLSGPWGEIPMPYQGNHYFNSELGFRFNLSANLTPGTYRWPVAITISSL